MHGMYVKKKKYLSILYILHRSTKYFVDRQQCKGKLVLRFNGNNQQLSITDSDTRTVPPD